MDASDAVPGPLPGQSTGHRAGRAAPSLLYAVKQVELAVRAGLDEMLRDSGVTALQYTALTVLERRDGLTAAELARNSFVTTQSMADLVGALSRLELIERRRDDDDRRRVLISLSDRGRDLLAVYAGPVADLERRMLAGLTDREVSGLRASLDQCRENLADGPAH